MSTTKTVAQKPKTYEERIAKSREVLKHLKRKRSFPEYIEPTIDIEKYL